MSASDVLNHRNDAAGNRAKEKCDLLHSGMLQIHQAQNALDPSREDLSHLPEQLAIVRHYIASENSRLPLTTCARQQVSNQGDCVRLTVFSVLAIRIALRRGGPFTCSKTFGRCLRS